jgi:hypothetical protein
MVGFVVAPGVPGTGVALPLHAAAARAAMASSEANFFLMSSPSRTRDCQAGGGVG